MGQGTLRSILEGAVKAFGEGRRADIGEARRHVVGILDAAGLGPAGGDIWSGLAFEDGALVVRTAYTPYGDRVDNSLSIPGAVIDAEDPILAARRWGLEFRIVGAERSVASIRKMVSAEEARLDALRSELADMTALAA